MVSAKGEIGTCETFSKKVREGRVYASKHSLALASGVPAAKVATTCEGCEKRIFVGVIGIRVFKDAKSYEHAVMAQKVVLAALEAAKKCEECAIGMLTDGKCESCGIEFKHGKTVHTE